MDLKIVFLAFVVFASLISSSSAGKHKKVIIHVPYKVKNFKHTHTIYKTIHHHDGGHGGGGHSHGHGKGHSHGHSHGHEEAEEHEHFHHHGDSHGHHSMVHPQIVLPKGPVHMKAVPYFKHEIV